MTLFAPTGRPVPAERRGPRATAKAVPADVILAALSEVTDPEWPVSIVDMGLVYAVAVEGSTVTLTLTFTATACPCMEMIQEDIRERLRRIPGVADVKIAISWDPPWTKARLSERAREAFRHWGVSV